MKKNCQTKIFYPWALIFEKKNLQSFDKGLKLSKNVQSSTFRLVSNSLTRFLIICHILEHISSNVLCVSYGLMVLKFIREYLSWGSNIKRVESGKKVQMCTSMQKKIVFVLFGQLLLFDRISKNITMVTS